MKYPRISYEIGWCLGGGVSNEAEGYRGLAQHGSPHSWLEKSDPAGVILYVMDAAHRLPIPYSTGYPDRSWLAAS